MTPLARRIVRDLTVKQENRIFTDRIGLSQKMDDVHCFDVSEVYPLIRQMALDGSVASLPADTSFLPAPKTFIEWEVRSNGVRMGALLIEQVGGRWADLYAAAWRGLRIQTSPAVCTIGLSARGGDHKKILVTTPLSEDAAELLGVHARLLQIALALINTPRIIGRQQHMPDWALERRLLKARRTIGHFPLHAWTEIKLKVHAPANLSDDEPVEAHLTGQRALHFCRAHLRIKMGRVEFVKAHWRGDASLGTKRSRYVVTQ